MQYKRIDNTEKKNTTANHGGKVTIFVCWYVNTKQNYFVVLADSSCLCQLWPLNHSRLNDDQIQDRFNLNVVSLDSLKRDL